MIDRMADSITSVTMFGSDILSQVLSGIALVVLLYVSLSILEYIYSSFMAMWKDRVELFPKTYVSGSKTFTAIQNPRNPKAKTIYFSDNQRSGVEFSYSMFLNIGSSTFTAGNHKLYHVLHKGYNQMYPLFGPGIFCWGDTNTLRVYMNCFDTWNNYSEIENIPVDKWFHLVVSCKGNTIYVYINGNLKSKIALTNNTPPYQNYGNVYAFSTRKMTINKTITTSLEADVNLQGQHSSSTLEFDGPISGALSRVYYFSYAVTYTEIQYLMNMGPSNEMEGANGLNQISPYLSDTWWANRQGP
jgi:hypothetical protein